MSASSEPKIAVKTTPKLSHQDKENPAIAKTETGTIVAVSPAPSQPQTDANHDNSLPALILFVPFIFLIAIVVLLIERTIKWALRRFFSPQPALPMAIAHSPMGILK